MRVVFRGSHRAAVIGTVVERNQGQGMKSRYLFLILSLLPLGGCNWPLIGAGAATAYLTKPSDPPPADTEDRVKTERLWCYRTLGDPECYAYAQDVPPNRLIATLPAKDQPTDLRAYHEAVLEGK